MGIDMKELEDYMQQVDPIPYAHDVVAFPAPKESDLGFPNPRSREILQHREEHVHDHLPHMYPNLKGNKDYNIGRLLLFSLINFKSKRFNSSVFIDLSHIQTITST